MQQLPPQDVLPKLKPERVVFVISVDNENKASGMIAAWNMKCSSDPPLFAVSLSRKGYTHKLIRKSGEFVVAVPNKEIEKELMFFGTTHGDEVDKFHETGIKTLPATTVRPPLLEDATANLECQLDKEVDVGDHILFIGRVVAAHLDENKKVLLAMKKVDGKRVFEEF